MVALSYLKRTCHNASKNANEAVYLVRGISTVTFRMQGVGKLGKHGALRGELTS